MLQRTSMMQAARMAPTGNFLGSSLTKRAYQPVLNSLSKNVISAEYAVRGQIPLRGEEIMKVLQKGDHTHY